MYLIELLLPLADNGGQRFESAAFDRTHEELVTAFGGITAFFRSPAAGAWEAPDGRVQRDTIVVLEVMTDDLDRGWWAEYKKRLEQRFSQDEIVVRSHTMDLL